MAMKPTKVYSITLASGAAANHLVAGDFFKILSATGSVTVDAPNFKLEGMTTGQGLEHTPFDRLTFTNTSGASNTIRFVVGDENFIDGTLGNVTVTSTVTANGAITQTTPAIGAAASNFLQVNATRRYMLIQNRDPAVTMYVRLDGNPATVGGGLKLGPGQTLEFSGFVPTGPASVIGDAAGTVTAVVMEG